MSFLSAIKKRISVYKDYHLIINSGLFNKAYYFEYNTDVKSAGFNGIMHFCKYGWSEGRNPSLDFDTNFYLTTYNDVKLTGKNPLIHYIKYGKREGRITKANLLEINYISQEELVSDRTREFNRFIDSNEKLDFACAKPLISIVLVLYNKAELTYACLKSILLFSENPIELIIVDNNSTDRTSDLLNRVQGAKIVRNKTNNHFLAACNQAFELVSCEYILLLNNDAILLKGSLSAAFKCIQGKETAAVGAKLILPDGTLQEAGSIIWCDGSAFGYGRGENPMHFSYNFRRNVDYCSGAFLLTKTKLIKEHQGFDPAFSPAYYEETDYCLWLQEKGYNVVYDPFVKIEHVEFGSGKIEDSILLQATNQQKFQKKHIKQLQKHFSPNQSNLLKARFSAKHKDILKLLFIEDKVPHLNNGAGHPRSNKILNMFVNLGYQVTLFPNTFPSEENWVDCYYDIDPSIEVAFGIGHLNFRSFFTERINYYDVIWVSRPHNLKLLLNDLRLRRNNLYLIYDAEAIFAERTIQKEDLFGRKFGNEEIARLHEEEISLCKEADHIVAVSDLDALKFKSFGITDITVLGHTLEVYNSKSRFEDRNGLLFVGNLDNEDSPNVDSVLWFTREVLPLIRKSLPSIEFLIIGSCNAQSVKSLQSEGIFVLNAIDDITPYYEKCKVFIAPTRYAAGIPYKIHESVAHGLPVVATELLANQLQWKHREQLFVSKAEKNDFAQKVIELYQNKTVWEKIRDNAQIEITKSHSFEGYKQKLHDLIRNILPEKP